MELDEEDVGCEVVELKGTLDAKLGELLHHVNSAEIKLCSAAAKEFIKLLKSNVGGELLRLYVRSSSSFTELVSAWKMQQGKAAIRHVFLLISAILSHPDGKYAGNDKERIGIIRVIDKFARSIVEDKLVVIYDELGSKEVKLQNAALMLLSSVVKRGSGLASEVAKSFNFKLPAFLKIAQFKKRRSNEKKKKRSTRKEFVRFAMSFLEVGKPGLLRWVLQQKEMYSGVLRVLEDDDDETVVYILSTLRDMVLSEHSLVPPNLRSVLFGSATLEQLISISARENGGPADELAHNLLVMVCTDPSNGLMPDLQRYPSPLRGNTKRLLDLMKKLRATEVGYHRDLLLAIVQGRPSFGSAYMKEYPYNLEDFGSPAWFSSVCLAANIVSSVGMGHPCAFLHCKSNDPPSFDSTDIQNIVNCIAPPVFSRSVINKGLLNSDFIIKNGSLRLLLEMLKLLDSFFKAMDYSSSKQHQRWVSLKKEIQNVIQSAFPDPQVFLTLLSSMNSCIKGDELSLKRKSQAGIFLQKCSKSKKKLKTSNTEDDADIVLGGISSSLNDDLPVRSEITEDAGMPDMVENLKDFVNILSELWGASLFSSKDVTTMKDGEMVFYSKLFDALKIYLLAMPTSLDGSFDFFMNLLSNHAALPAYMISSLLALLVEYIKWSPRSGVAVKTPPLMYKRLQPFLNLFIFSPVDGIRVQAYNLARACMFSSGAFDRNLHEIDAWFMYLSGYSAIESSAAVQGTEVLKSLSLLVISFLCDAVSTVGNNLFRYWDILRNDVSHLEEFKDVLPEFSPLIGCVLQKCERLLNSESGTYSIPEKSTISLYVCNTLKYLLQTQVDAGLLSALIKSVLSKVLEQRFSMDEDSVNSFCEWRPLKNLLFFAESVCQKRCCFSSKDQKAAPATGSFTRTLDEVQKIILTGDGGEISGVMKAFSSALICTSGHEVLSNFPLVISISHYLQVPVSFLSLVLNCEQSFLAGIIKLWPKVSLSSLVTTANSQAMKDNAFSEDKIDVTAFDPSDKVSATTFSHFLRESQFDVLFPAVMSIDILYLEESSTISGILLAKLSECSSDHLVSYLRLLLFWLSQIQSAYTISPSIELEQIAEFCHNFMNQILNQLLALKSDSDTLIQDAAHTIFLHPAVAAFLVSPMGWNKDFTREKIGGSLEDFIKFSGEGLHKIDHYILDLLIKTLGCLSSSSKGFRFILSSQDESLLRFVKPFKTLLKKLYVQLKEKCDVCSKIEAILPYFYALHVLKQFISPFELLEFVHSLFGKTNVNLTAGQESYQRSILYVGFCLTADAFETLSVSFLQPVIENGQLQTVWGSEERNYCIKLIEQIFVELCRFAIEHEMDAAYICLLKISNSVYKHSCMQKEILHPLSMVLSRIMINSPLEIVSHCIYRTNKTKASLLSALIEMSSLHLSVFGYVLSGVLKVDSHPRGKVMGDNSGLVPSEDDLIMLLPALFVYLKSNIRKLDNKFTEISAFYSKMLLNKFQSWNSFATASLFQENFDESLPSSVKGLLNLVDGSLLGKAVQMLEWHFALGGDMAIEEQLKLFDSVYSSSSGHNKLLDCDVRALELNSPIQSLNFVNRVVAKIRLAWLLLIKDKHAETDGNQDDASREIVGNKEAQSKIQFINILVDAWKSMVKKLTSVSDNSTKERNSNCLQLIRYLELFILGKILELSVKMQDALIQLQSIPFLEKLMKLSLLHRFEDPTTLRIVRNILTVLKEGKFSCALYLQLLLAHSQFASTIGGVTESFTSHIGPLFRPFSSILRSVDAPHPESKQDQQKTEMYLKKLEVVKLLRILSQLRPRLIESHGGKDIGINRKELYLLLLSSYGATLSEIDMEIYAVMQEIESLDKSIFDDSANMDYLWGSAALKVCTEQTLEQNVTPKLMADAAAAKEFRKSQFRENLPVDPKLCVNTVLHFPYDRTANSESLSVNGIELDNLKHIYELHATEVGSSKQYDPVFILRFSLHALSMGYLEPLEFASLGLLAISFVSMSSPDLTMRKLGYEFLGRYKNSIEKSQKRTDRMRIRLLLTYLQNGIEEPWQRIPSTMALFAAESSFVLLDPLHDNYSAISNHLMHSSKMNMRTIPLFQSLFQSNSANSRAEGLWMLRLVYAGLSLNDDAQIYVRNSIVETLLSFYVSPLLNNEAKKLILQIVKKSVKLPTTASYLVEHCGLFPWLSSIISTFSNEHEKTALSQQLITIAEVVNDVVSIGNIAEWLQNCALVQLISLASHFYKLLAGGLELIKENSALVHSILQIVMQAMKMSQKRKLYQPHFTLSTVGIFQIYSAVRDCNTATSSANEDIGLKTILMSTPPVDILNMDPEKLLSFLSWAVSTALKVDSGRDSLGKESDAPLVIMSEEVTSDECLIMKLLRWLVASVILAKLSCKLNATKSSEPSSMTLQSVLECCRESNASRHGCEECLTATILFLQQHHGVDFELLPSVLSALALLLFCDASKRLDANSDYTTAAASLCTRIRAPTEANPAWRWSYYKPWKDLSSEQIKLQKVDELHACQTLLVMVSNVLAKKPLESQLLTYQDAEKCGVFEWQRTLVEAEPR